MSTSTTQTGHLNLALDSLATMTNNTLVGGNQVINNFGFSAADVERVLEKILAVHQAGLQLQAAGPSTNRHWWVDLPDGDRLTLREAGVRQLFEQHSPRAYLLGLLTEHAYRRWANEFVPPAGRMEVEPPLTLWHTPIPEAPPREEKLDNILDAVNTHHCFLLLGEPGAGKTTTLRKLAFEMAQAHLASPTMPVPLFVRLSEQKQQTPLHFLTDRWHKAMGTDLTAALRAGQAMILADGTNELPRADRADRLRAWRTLVAESIYAGWCIFTSRADDAPLLDLPRVRVDPFDDDRIQEYLNRYQAAALWPALHTLGLLDLARNPFNLAMLVQAWQADPAHQLGRNRSRLLAGFVERLLWRELQRESTHFDPDLLAQDPKLALRPPLEALSQLAFDLQTQGDSLTVPAEKACAVLPTTVMVAGRAVPTPPAAMLELARAASVLDPAGLDDIRFYHQLLQEYLAARVLLRRFEAGDDLRARCWQAKRLAHEMPPATTGAWDPLPPPPATGWEQTTVLAAGLAADPMPLLKAVRAVNPILAGRLVVEAGHPALHPDLPVANDSPLNPVRADLLADLCNPALHLRTRLEAGRVLGQVGDPRLAPQTVHGQTVILPTLCPVPAGFYPLGLDNSPYEDERPARVYDLPAFEIGRWPVTNAEFRCFVQAGGYADPRWWPEPLAAAWWRGEPVAGLIRVDDLLQLRQAVQAKPEILQTLVEQLQPEQIEALEALVAMSEADVRAQFGEATLRADRAQPAFWDEANFNAPNQPVVGVTWFEAQAYTLWLAALTGQPFRLPSEREWEAAARGLLARGGAERVYPWGQTFDPAQANTLEGRVLRPSPVGAYAAAGAVSPTGAEDQSGNVAEWTASLYLPYPYQPAQAEDPHAPGLRVVRGGAWNYLSIVARAVFRYRLEPDDLNDVVGFRVVRAPVGLGS